jgi:hypothetical protein
MSEQQLVEDDVVPVDAGSPPTESSPEPSPPEPGAREDGDELERALAEFDQSISRPAPAVPQPAAAAEPDNPIDALLTDFDALQADPTRQQIVANADEQLRNENAQLAQRIEALRQAYVRERDVQEFDNLAADLGKQLAQDLPDFPPAYARARLYELAMTEQALVTIFDNRHAYPDRWRAAKKAIGKMLYQEWKSRPDSQATADRAAVVHAMRGASERGELPEPEIAWGQLSPQEFEVEKRKLGL